MMILPSNFEFKGARDMGDRKVEMGSDVKSTRITLPTQGKLVFGQYRVALPLLHSLPDRQLIRKPHWESRELYLSTMALVAASCH